MDREVAGAEGSVLINRFVTMVKPNRDPMVRNKFRILRFPTLIMLISQPDYDGVFCDEGFCINLVSNLARKVKKGFCRGHPEVFGRADFRDYLRHLSGFE